MDERCINLWSSDKMLGAVQAQMWRQVVNFSELELIKKTQSMFQKWQAGSDIAETFFKVE